MILTLLFIICNDMFLFFFSIFIGSTKPFSFAQICRSKDQMFEQSIMG